MYGIDVIQSVLGYMESKGLYTSTRVRDPYTLEHILDFDDGKHDQRIMIKIEKNITDTGITILTHIIEEKI
jgi:hypothetical protein